MARAQRKAKTRSTSFLLFVDAFVLPISTHKGCIMYSFRSDPVAILLRHEIFEKVMCGVFNLLSE